MLIQSSSQGLFVHSQGHLRSCQVSHQSKEKREEKIEHVKVFINSFTQEIADSIPVYTKLLISFLYVEG